VTCRSMRRRVGDLLSRKHRPTSPAHTSDSFGARTRTNASTQIEPDVWLEGHVSTPLDVHAGKADIAMSVCVCLSSLCMCVCVSSATMKERITGFFAFSNVLLSTTGDAVLRVEESAHLPVKTRVLTGVANQRSGGGSGRESDARISARQCRLAM
jgi:hypothetical protein